MRDTLCEKQGVREAAIRRRDSTPNNAKLSIFNFQIGSYNGRFNRLSYIQPDIELRGLRLNEMYRIMNTTQFTFD